MGKILNISDEMPIDEFIEGVSSAMRKNGKKIVFAIECLNGDVETGYFMCNPAEQQMLVSHLQLDIIKRMIDINYVTDTE